jgi:DNA gyrase subunit B
VTDQSEPQYSADQLTVLEGLDAVRKRPGMYIGSTDSPGLQHCMWEIIDNAVDEALAGHCHTINVTLHGDGSVEVTDDGRGIPVDVNAKSGLSGVELVMTKLHAGGKFGGGSYGSTGGLHGVGASVVNALSQRLDVTVTRDGHDHHISFRRGEAGIFADDGTFTPASGLRTGAKAEGTGTRVRYWADTQIFLPGADIDLAKTWNRARQTAFLVPGLTLNVTDLREGTGEDDRERTFSFDGGMADYVEYLTAGKAITDVLTITGTGEYSETVPVLEDGVMTTRDVARTMTVEVALRWDAGYDTTVKSFVNIVETPKGGTHVAGFERALNRATNDALRAAKLLKVNDESVVKDDVQEGLVACVLVRIAEPQFEGQTKEILGTAAAQSIVYQTVLDAMKDHFADKRRRDQLRRALAKIAEAAKTRKAARAHKETLRKKNAVESSSLPAKLADCTSTDTERTELMIVEGDSAAGSTKGGRDSEFQAVLPIRGKILNTLRATERKMLDNRECADLISAVGAGSGRSFDVDAIRYGKLILVMDADVDGSHIRTLLLTLVFRYMTPLLEQGRVFSAVPPLHKIIFEDKKQPPVYTYTDAELTQVKSRLDAEGRRIKDVQRYKGLGEMTAEQLAETTLDPDVRKLRQITMSDAVEAEQLFEILMGDDVAARRDYIFAHSDLVDVAQLDV